RLKLGLLEAPVAEMPARDTLHGAGTGGNVSYFPGCLARYLQPSVARATARLATAAGHSLVIPAAQGCCGLAAHAAGRKDEARELAWNNILAFAESSGPVLTSCASCSSHLAAYPELFQDDPEKLARAREFCGRVVEFSAFFLARLNLRPASRQERKVLYHDPCHLRHSDSGRKNPRELIDRIDNVERVEPANGPHCCGQGGLFHLGYPETSSTIFRQCAKNGLERAPDMVVTTCSGCLMQWQQGREEHDLPVEVAHLAVLLADCLD
ncbi:MAG TPA: (Fe-S)-binding protein, partial [Desulfobulbus sp.]|nr:(Fe-S)-binding protein [Desulfobulbus sp.]